MTQQRRRTQWYESIQGEIAIGAGASQNNDLLSNIATSDRQGATVTRILIQIRFHPAAITLLHECFWGIAIVNADALAVGALPDTQVVDDTNWLMHSRMHARSANLSGNEGDFLVVMDLRAQRVLRAQQDRLILMFDNIGPAANRSHFIRTLMRLS